MVKVGDISSAGEGWNDRSYVTSVEDEISATRWADNWQVPTKELKVMGSKLTALLARSIERNKFHVPFAVKINTNRAGEWN